MEVYPAKLDTLPLLRLLISLSEKCKSVQRLSVRPCSLHPPPCIHYSSPMGPLTLFNRASLHHGLCTCCSIWNALPPDSHVAFSRSPSILCSHVNFFVRPFLKCPAPTPHPPAFIATSLTHRVSFLILGIARFPLTEI